MKSMVRRLMLLGLTAIVSLASAKERWLYAKSDNFEMYSSASEKDSRQILDKLEQFRAFFLASLPLRRAREPRTFVVVFDSDRAFKDYKPLYQGRPKNVAGYCLTSDDEAVMALTTDTDPDLEDEGDATRIVLHEFVHLMLQTRGVNPPLWLNEGLAEFFSTFDVKEGQVEIGRPKDLYVEYLSQSALPSLREVFSATRKSKTYNDENQAPQFYAESWALTHYLICGTDVSNREKLSRFLATQEKEPEGADPVKSFEQAFGLSYGEMQSRLRDYLNGGRYRIRVAKLPRPDLAKRLSFQPASEFDVQMMLLDTKWRIRQDGAAIATALQLADQHPESPRPQELLAAIYTETDRRREALDHWRRAAALGSVNPYVYVELARDTLDRGDGALHVDDRVTEPMAAQLRGWIDHALQINPDSADALEALALTEAMAPEIRVAAVNRVQGAISRIRDPLPTLVALGIVRWRLGDPKTARQIADLVLADHHARARLQATAKELRARAAAALGASSIAAPPADPPH
jgi:tetratricopeptide (TPR) repeat protein